MKTMMNLNKSVIINDTIFYKNVIQRLCTGVNKSLTELEKLKTQYSDEQLIFVLQKLKKFSMTEMQKYGINENEFKKLESIKYDYKSKPTNILNEIISYNVMNVSDLTNLCNNITSGKRKSNYKSLIQTAIGTADFKDIKTAIGLRTGLNCITWTQLDLTSSMCNVLKLDSSDNIMGACTEAPDIIKRSMDVVKNLPIVDAYIIEKQPIKLPSSKLNYSTMQILMQKEQVFSGIIAGLLKNIELQKTTHPCTLYFLRAFASANYYKLLLGKEIVSADNIIQAILTKKYAGDHLSVSISNELLNYYHSVDLFQKEELNLTLLLTIMFFENIILTNMKQ